MPIDVIIVEDDPYYFLQMGEYTPKAGRAPHAEFTDPTAWLASLVPSYVKWAFLCCSYRFTLI